MIVNQLCVCDSHAAKLEHATSSTKVCLNAAHNVLAGENSIQRCSRQPSARNCIPFVSVSAFAEACSSMLSTVGLRQQALAPKPCCAAHCSFGLWPLKSGRPSTVGRHRGTHTQQTWRCQAFCTTSTDCCSNSRSSICCNWPVSYCRIIYPMVSCAAVTVVMTLQWSQRMYKSYIHGCICILQDWYLKFRDWVTMHIMCRADCLFSWTHRIDMLDFSTIANLLQVDDGSCKSTIIVKLMLCLFKFVPTSESWHETNPAKCAYNWKRICKQHHIHASQLLPKYTQDQLVNRP